MGTVHVPGNVAIMFDGPTGDVTDGSHSFAELYAHRCSLFVALMLNAAVPAWRSRKNADGSMYDGWFLAGMELTQGTAITYHLPDHMWAWLDAPRIATLEQGPPWDGHTSDDVIRRLASWCGAFKQEEQADEEESPEGAGGDVIGGAGEDARGSIDQDAESLPEGSS